MSPLHSLANSPNQNLPQSPFPQPTPQGSFANTFHHDQKFSSWQALGAGLKQDVKENIEPTRVTGLHGSTAKKSPSGPSPGPTESINKLKSSRSSKDAGKKMSIDCILLPKISPQILRKYRKAMIVPTVGASTWLKEGPSTSTGPKVDARQLPKTSSSDSEDAELNRDTAQTGSSQLKNENVSAQGAGATVQPGVEKTGDADSISDEASQGSSEGTTDYDHRIRSHFRYTPYPPGYGTPAHLRRLNRVFVDASASAKAIREQKAARGDGEPIYKVSIHKTRFERYEELMTELFGPGDVMRGSNNRKHRARVHWDKSVVDAQSSGTSMEIDSEVPEAAPMLTLSPVKRCAQASTSTSGLVSESDAVPPIRSHLSRGVPKKPTALSEDENYGLSSLTRNSLHETLINLPQDNSNEQTGPKSSSVYERDLNVLESSAGATQENLSHLNDRSEVPGEIHQESNGVLRTPSPDSATASQTNGSPMISIPPNRLPSEPEPAPQVSYFNVDEWKITLQRFIKGKGPAVSQPDVIAVLQVFTAIESMVDAARNDPVVRNLIFMLREYFTAVQNLPEGHIPSGDPFRFRARASQILSFATTPT